MLVSIIITVKNEREHINGLLDSFMRQTHPFEVIFVDAYSDDGTYEILEAYSKYRSTVNVYRVEGNRAKGRNFGVGVAKGDVIAFVDGNCILDKDWIDNIRKSIKIGHNIVYGKTIVLGKKKCRNRKRLKIVYSNNDISVPTCNLIVKKEVFKKVGMFSEELVPADDLDFNIRCVNEGYYIAEDENIIIKKTCRKHNGSSCRKYYNKGISRGKLLNRYESIVIGKDMKKLFRDNYEPNFLRRRFFSCLGFTISRIRKE